MNRTQSRTINDVIFIDEAARPTVTSTTARIWVQPVEIPTYRTGRPTPHPMYLEGRVYQGSSGKVYPLPLVEHIEDSPTATVYTAVFLENRHVKLMVLPELGGRIHMAYDKQRDYHFVYFNRVIKPALVGLAGPWIAGGIEFNWPQHHRPSTYSPVEFQVSDDNHEHATVFLSDIDRMYGLRVTTSISLLPDDVRIHIESEVSNRTTLDQTFLWWANPAVAVNEEYQAIFPPDVHAVLDHGKRDVSRFPIATGTYYKVDYAHGVDISWYRNIPVPTSYMAHYSRFDFVGGYDHGRRAGLLHSAENRISPGKKLWTWGNGDFARAWERNLTDEDGPYIELMTGVYSENQPDFTWISPGETKRFTQHFYPYIDLARVLSANKHGALNLEREGDDIILSVYSTHAHTVRPVVTRGAEAVELESADLAAHTVKRWRFSGAFGNPDGVGRIDTVGIDEVSLLDKTGNTVLSFKSTETGDKSIPEPASAPPAPESAASAEDLYLIGVHLEQYRHATLDPVRYYEEAIRRDSGHSASHVAMARRLLRCNRPVEALEHAQKAVSRLTAWNNNPETGRAHYYEGLCCAALGRTEQAIDAFGKATWCIDSRAIAHFELATLALRRSEPAEALRHIDASLNDAPRFERALHLRTSVVRRLGLLDEFESTCSLAESINCLSYYVACERFLNAAVRLNSPGNPTAGSSTIAAWNSSWGTTWSEALGSNVERFLEVLCEYAHSGCYSEIIDLVSVYAHAAVDRLHPMPFYLAAWAVDRASRKIDGSFDSRHNDAPGGKVGIRVGTRFGEATPEDWLGEAENQSFEAVFPVRGEELNALRFAVSQRRICPMAHYYLANALYDRGDYEEAFELWTTSVEHMPALAGAHRNIAVYLHNKAARSAVAVSAMERAVESEPTDARLLLELDDLYRRVGRTMPERLALLNARCGIVGERDDLTIRRAGLLTSSGEPERALALISDRHFHPWEGGEGVVPGEYRRAHIRLGLYALIDGDTVGAITELRRAKEYPDNLGEGKLPITPDNELDYWIGVCLTRAGDTDAAKQSFTTASEGDQKPALSMYYNDAPARAILYRGLAWRALSDEVEARRCFFGLRDYGERHESDTVEPDYFAVSFPDLVVFEYDLTSRHRNFCKLVKALGFMGLGNRSSAERNLAQVMQSDPADPDAIDHLFLLEQKELIGMMHL